MRLDSMRTQVLGGGLRLAVARGPWQRGRGLMRMDELPAGHALRIPRCASVHTFGMRFAVDLVWLDRDDRILRIDHGVGARAFKACRGAKAVVETRAGEGDRFAAAIAAAAIE